MRRKNITRLLSILLLLFALSMAFPLAIALFLSEAEMIRGFGLTAAFSIAAAAVTLLVTRKSDISFLSKDGFLLVFLTWVMASVVGALPFYISGCIPDFADAVFESVSGFTTTGSSIIVDVEIMPRSLIFWRAETHWLGGMGIVVLFVALLPLLGAGGSRLIKAETTGPDKERITPKITETARILWLIYIALTAFETVLLVIAGMSWFDAVTHSFSTIGTGGFSSRNAGIAYWNSPAILWIVSVFMILAGLNFTLIFRAVQRKWKDVWFSSEGRAYFAIILAATVIIAVSLLLAGRNMDRAAEAAAESTANAAEQPLTAKEAETAGGIAYAKPLTTAAGSVGTALFYTASVLTTTGFGAGGLGLLPPVACAVLFFLMFIGGCSGSTAGGIKVIRVVVLFKQTYNEVKRLRYPQGVFSVHLNNKVGRKDVVYGVAGFIYLYFALLAVSTLVVASSGFDPFRSFCVSLISLGNIGLDPSLPDPVAAFRNFPGYVKWTLSFVMIAGRLELWTALMFFSKEYWK